MTINFRVDIEEGRRRRKRELQKIYRSTPEYKAKLKVKTSTPEYREKERQRVALYRKNNHEHCLALERARCSTEAYKERVHLRYKDRYAHRKDLYLQRHKAWVILNRSSEKFKEARRRQGERRRTRLTDGYIAGLLGVRVGEVSPEIIEAKRSILKVRHLVCK